MTWRQFQGDGLPVRGRGHPDSCAHGHMTDRACREGRQGRSNLLGPSGIRKALRAAAGPASAPGSALGEARPAHAGPHTYTARRSKRLTRHTGRAQRTVPPSSPPIDQLAVTTSMASLSGRRMRSAMPTIDPAPTHKGSVPTSRKRSGPGLSRRNRSWTTYRHSIPCGRRRA
jgi:hypothetical protein